MTDNRKRIKGVESWYAKLIKHTLSKRGYINKSTYKITDDIWNECWILNYTSLKNEVKGFSFAFNITLPRKQKVEKAIKFYVDSINGTPSNTLEKPTTNTVRFIHLLAEISYSPELPNGITSYEKLDEEFLKPKKRDAPKSLVDVLKWNLKSHSVDGSTILFTDPGMIYHLDDHKSKVTQYPNILCFLPCVFSDERLLDEIVYRSKKSKCEVQSIYLELYRKAIVFAIDCYANGYEGNIQIRWNNRLFSSLKRVGCYVNPLNSSHSTSRSIINDSRSAFCFQRDLSYGLHTSSVKELELIMQHFSISESILNHSKIEQIQESIEAMDLIIPDRLV